MIRLTRKYQFPKYLRQFKELKGICIGGCADRTRFIPDKHWAHAHCHQIGDKYAGWICLRYKFQLRMKLLMLHEMAHLLTPFYCTTHGKEWRQALWSIGGTVKSFVYRLNNKIYTNLDYTYRPRKE